MPTGSAKAVTAWADVVSRGTVAAVSAAMHDLDTMSATVHFEPSPSVVMRPFALTPPDDVRCVILGGAPSPVSGASDGLAWSDPRPLREAAPVTRAILAEWVADGGEHMPQTGSLASWASHGVLLVNEVPTASAVRPELSAMMWSDAMASVVTDLLAWSTHPIVLVAWGRRRLVTANAIVGSLEPSRRADFPVIASMEPTPLPSRVSSHGLVPFAGSDPFVHVNDALAKHGVSPIDWSL